MAHLNILIKEKSDLEPAWPDMNPANTAEGELEAAAILEGGMVSGKTSISFRIKLPDGRFVFTKTSAAVLDGLWHAVKGAEERFLNNKG